MTPAIFDLTNKRIFVAGHKGMVGSAVVRRLEREACHVLTAERSELDLTRQDETERWLDRKQPEVVIMAAARVGGILANNNFPVEFLSENLAIELNLIRAAYKVKVQKLLFLGSSCIYPRLASQPISENLLLTGPLEPTNKWYSIAKIAGIMLCQAYRQQFGCDFISAMPTNLYGPRDNYHSENSHVPAALLRRFHEAKVAKLPSVVVWGTGRPLRDFLYVDDLADACIFLLKHYSHEEIINVGTGQEISVSRFAEIVSHIVQYRGQIGFDHSKPDGTPRKLLDISRIMKLGWLPSTALLDGLAYTYQDFIRSCGPPIGPTDQGSRRTIIQ